MTPGAAAAAPDELTLYRYQLAEMMAAVAPAFVADMLANTGAETPAKAMERIMLTSKRCRIVAQMLLAEAHNAVIPDLDAKLPEPVKPAALVLG